MEIAYKQFENVITNLPDEDSPDIINGFDTDIRGHLISRAAVSKIRFQNNFLDTESNVASKQDILASVSFFSELEGKNPLKIETKLGPGEEATKEANVEDQDEGEGEESEHSHYSDVQDGMFHDISAIHRADVIYYLCQ